MDNTKVVYVQKLTSGGIVVGIWVMNADGTGKTQIYTPSVNSWYIYPSWTPDGRIIIYNFIEGKLYIATAGGTITTQISLNYGQTNSASRVSPDGKKLYLTRQIKLMLLISTMAPR